MAQAIAPFTAKDLPWKLIVILAAIGLLWPTSKALGITDELPPVVIGAVWFSIRILWIIVVLAVRDKRPFWTLLTTSLLYEVVALVPQQINWDQESAARIPAAIATLIVGAVTGALIGLIAAGIRRLTKK